MKYSKIKLLKTENIKNEKSKSGIYVLMNKYKTSIYVGCSENVRHRLKAVLYGRADWSQVRGKDKIRNMVKYYKNAYIPIKKARKLEKRKKENMRYNKL